MKHWDKLKANTPDGTWLAGNVLIMQKILDKLGRDVYAMQEEIGSDCPVCFVSEEILDDVIKEINAGAEA